MTISNKRSNIIAAMLLLLFLSFQGGRMFCYHTHVFGNSVIAHSHPFHNSDRQHTATELASLSIISLSSFDDEIGHSPELHQFTSYTLIIDRWINQQVINLHLSQLSDRAPPIA